MTRMKKFLDILLTMALISVFVFSPTSQIASAQDIPTDLDTAVSTDQNIPSINFNGCTPVNYPATNFAYEQEVIMLVNQERVSRGVPPLKYNSELSNASRYHVIDLMQDNYFNHDSYDVQNGSLVQVCGWSTRVDKFYFNRAWIGENLAAGYNSPAAAVAGWMSSTGHRENILSTNYREMGAGYASGGGNYYYYWGQDFGSRSTVYPVIINNEAIETTSSSVNLYVYGAGMFNEMRLRNDSGAWSSWRPFQTSFSWTINAVAGVRTVSIELRRSGEETVSSASDTITYVSLTPHLTASPASLLFVYNQAEGRLSPSNYSVQPGNSANDTAISWQASTGQSWISLTNTSGQTPAGLLTVGLTAEKFAQPGDYSGSVAITASAPAGTENSPLSIPVRLIVVTDLPNKLYLPVVKR